MKHKMQFYLNFVILLVILGCAFSAQSKINLNSNGYEGIVVAIGRDVTEDLTIIQKIKDMFADGSKTLFRATKHKAYFKNITILVPNTWSSASTYQEAGRQSFVNANIRVDEANPVYGDTPYTQQLGKCGQPADFTHFSPGFLVNKNSVDKYGPLGKVLVHEWGHLRWGLFDEYVRPEDNIHFYQVGKDLVPVRCTEGINGYPINPNTKKPCKFNLDTLKVEEDCRFIPYKDNTAKASMMFMQFLESVSDFCDNGTLSDNAIIHNKDAPNIHNIKCQGKSAWEIMKEHEDFKGTKQADPLTDTTPSFTVVRESQMKLVLVLDVNKSLMKNGGTPLRLMRQASWNFIMNIIPNGTYVGIVSIGDESGNYISRNLTKITSKSDRENMVNALPSVADANGRCVGCGITNALKVLKQSGNGNGHIIVISNGKETGSPTVKNVVDNDIINAGLSVTIDTVTFTNETIPELGYASKTTGGFSLYADTGPHSTSLIGALVTTVAKSRNYASSLSPILIENYGLPHHAMFGPYEWRIFIERNAGKDTRFSFFYSDVIIAEITSPDDVVYNSSSKFFNDNKTFKVVEFVIPDIAKSGMWQYKVSSIYSPTGSNASDIIFVATTKPVNEAGPIRSSTWTDTGNLNFGNSKGIRIYAKVTRVTSPVLKANVFAEFTDENGNVLKDKLNLFDTGIGFDEMKNDGIYTGFLGYGQINGNGLFSYHVKVQNDLGFAIIPLARLSSGSLPIPTNTTMYLPPSYVNVDKFERFSQGQIIQVSGYTPGATDNTPPGMIRDLTFNQVQVKTKVVEFQWTAVGDNLYYGKASKYDIRTSTDSSTLLQSYNSATSLTSNMVISGNINNPKESGQKELFKFNLGGLNENKTHFIAVKAVDMKGNIGPVSNIVIFSLQVPTESAGFDFGIKPTQTPAPPVNPTDNGDVIIIVIGVILASVVIISLIIGLVVIRQRKKEGVVSSDSSVAYSNSIEGGDKNNAV